MKTIWRTTETGLVPTDDDAWAALHAHGAKGKEVLVEIKGARNIKQLRLFWALCQVVAENDEHYDTKDKARKGILRALEHVDTFVDRGGNLHIEVKSIAEGSLTQAEFNVLFTDAVNLVCKWTGNQPQEIRDQVDQMVAEKRYERR